MAHFADPPARLLSEALRRELAAAPVMWVPTEIVANPNLTPGAKFLYSVLLNYSWKSAVVNPSHQTLAREIGASARATRNYITELEQARLISYESRAGKPNHYWIETAR